ncbi:MAG: PKD domain-containing protein, partial [Phycisphaerales bacterium]
RIQFMKDIIEALPYQEMEPDFSHHPDVCMLAQPGKCYLIYFAGKREVELVLPEGRPYKVDGIDTWQMKTLPIGTARAGQFRFTPPKEGYAIQLTRYAPGENIRPEASASADQTEGIAPMTVRFSTPWTGQCRWDFGDATRSTQRSPIHTFDEPGVYAVTLTVTDESGASGGTTLPILVDRNSTDPVIRFGFVDGDDPDVTLHGGQVTRSNDGAYDLGSGEPFTWIQMGDEPITELEGVRSLTIMGWLKASSVQVGSGGNRILFSLQRDHSGLDLVHHADGTMRLAVNEWPDGIRNDSSKGKVQIGKWIFFAVTYDATKSKDNTCWYFGDENTPAEPDRMTNYSNGPVGQGSGHLVIGNFNKTLQGAGLDRQFRGQIRGLQIYASQLGTRGALSLEAIRRCQRDK